MNITNEIQPRAVVDTISARFMLKIVIRLLACPHTSSPARSLQAWFLADFHHGRNYFTLATVCSGVSSWGGSSLNQDQRRLADEAEIRNVLVSTSLRLCREKTSLAMGMERTSGVFLKFTQLLVSLARWCHLPALLN